MSSNINYKVLYEKLGDILYVYNLLIIGRKKKVSKPKVLCHFPN